MSNTRTRESCAQWGIDLTTEALAGRLDPLVGREAILERVLLVLARKTKNNPVLLGQPGVGKTAIAEGLALRLIEGSVPARLRGSALFSLNLGNLLAGTSCRGDFEQRLQLLVEQLRNPASPRILFIDELHLLAKAGRSEGGIDCANLLKPLLARGALPCLGATTPAEWEQMLAADPALERRFQPIEVPPATAEETRTILRGLRQSYADYHEVDIDDEALLAAVEAALRNPQGRLLPDRAIDLLDEACAALAMRHRNAAARPAGDRRDAVRDAMDRFDLATVARLLHGGSHAVLQKRPRLGANQLSSSHIPADFRL